MPSKKTWMAALLLAAGSLLLMAPTSGNPERYVLQLTVHDAIGPATDDYIARALNQAALEPVELVVLRMDTPGGLDTAMRSIIKNIINSPVPVATYVTPSGSRAASAGTYILYASHIAAMTPGTNLGAATPVQIGGGEGGGKPAEEDPDKAEKNGADRALGNQDAMRSKAINDAVAYIRGLAEMRGRNAEWAEKAVREAASLPAKEALEQNVIDIVATGMADLLNQTDGRKVMVQGQERTLHTAGLQIVSLDPDWRNRLLSVITNPNVAYILMLIGIYGLIFEFSNPGAIVPGTVGAICLLLALYSFQLLPINYAGMALILLGVALMVGEAFQPSFGMLGIGGVIAFIFGSIILMDTEVPGFGIHLSVIITFALISALIFIFVVGMAMQSRHRKVVTGSEQMLGSEAVATEDFAQEGMVFVHSELWRAHSNQPVHKGQRLVVTAMHGLMLDVEPISKLNQEKVS